MSPWLNSPQRSSFFFIFTCLKSYRILLIYSLRVCVFFLSGAQQNQKTNPIPVAGYSSEEKLHTKCSSLCEWESAFTWVVTTVTSPASTTLCHCQSWFTSNSSPVQRHVAVKDQGNEKLKEMNTVQRNSEAMCSID